MQRLWHNGIVARAAAIGEDHEERAALLLMLAPLFLGAVALLAAQTPKLERSIRGLFSEVHLDQRYGRALPRIETARTVTAAPMSFTKEIASVASIGVADGLTMAGVDTQLVPVAAIATLSFAQPHAALPPTLAAALSDEPAAEPIEAPISIGQVALAVPLDVHRSLQAPFEVSASSLQEQVRSVAAVEIAPAALFLPSPRSAARPDGSEVRPVAAGELMAPDLETSVLPIKDLASLPATEMAAVEITSLDEREAHLFASELRQCELNPAVTPEMAAAGPMSTSQRLGDRIAAAAAVQLSDFVIYNEAYRRIRYPMGDVSPLYGVCTDVVVRALRAVGIDLQEAVQTSGVGRGDKNIDHRRTEVLRRFFERAGTAVPVSSYAEDYKPGDIITYARPQNRGSRSHIAIVADEQSPTGRPLVIHNRGWGPRMEDALFVDRITGHYRLNDQTAARIASVSASRDGLQGHVLPRITLRPVRARSLLSRGSSRQRVATGR